jgi:molybdopterin synthase sulfur carrier subunit
MYLKVLFFGATADIVGAREMQIEVLANDSASSVFERIAAVYPPLAKHKLLFALNQQYVDGSTTLHEGDELAIFTAVSGG